MQIDQLFEFVYILIDKKQVTAKDMAKRFGVSTRTIYRWLEALSVSGIPVYSLKGRGGGIAISENYVLDKTLLTEEEKLELVSSVKALNSLSGIKSAGEKLSRLVSADTDWLEVDFSPWSPEGQGVKQLFALLKDSILKKKQITFDYYGTGRSCEKRTVHPWKLVYKGQAWYLSGFCTTRKEQRFFKLSRMLNVKETSRTANITQSKLDKEKNVEKGETGGKNKNDAQNKTGRNNPKTASFILIKAKVKAPSAFYFLDSFACKEIRTSRDGSINVTFNAPDEPWLSGMLLSFGTDLKIISPPEIKNKVEYMAKGVVGMYRKK